MKQRLLQLLILFWISTGTSAFACQGRPFGQPTATVGIPALTLSYSGALAIGTIPVTVTLPPVMNGNCHLSLMVEAGYPMQLTLQHAQTPQNMLTYSIGSPFEFNGSSFHTYMYAAQGQVYDFQVPVRIPANQNRKPAGPYQRYLSIRLLNTINGAAFSDIPVLVTAQVAGTCTLPPPTTSVLDFSPAIVNGSIPVAFQRSLSFSNAGCNGPARLTLAAQPLTKPGGGTPIHFSASAVLGGTAVSLDTQATASSFTNAISAPESGSVPVTVTVLPTAAPLPAGIYSSHLRVSLEPAQ